jgi:DNA-directed RNA polymerase subunit RPC12/RpoP
MGEDPHEGKAVGGDLSVSTSSIWALPSPEEERDKYVELIRAKRRLAMPDACCKCGKVFKPWSLDRNEEGWPPYEEVPCPKCGNKVLVFSDKNMEKRYYENKLMETKLTKRVEQIEHVLGLSKDRKHEKTLLERMEMVEKVIVNLVQGKTPQKPPPLPD